MNRAGLEIHDAKFVGHETFPLRLLWLKKVFEEAPDGAGGLLCSAHRPAVSSAG